MRSLMRQWFLKQANDQSTPCQHHVSSALVVSRTTPSPPCGCISALYLRFEPPNILYRRVYNSSAVSNNCLIVTEMWYDHVLAYLITNPNHLVIRFSHHSFFITLRLFTTGSAYWIFMFSKADQNFTSFTDAGDGPRN